jgi:hypothetical protein
MMTEERTSIGGLRDRSWPWQSVNRGFHPVRDALA